MHGTTAFTLEAVGEVVLTAANADVSDPHTPSHPAVVNHVVYFGDGVSPKTVLRGFRITGARNFTTGSGEKSPIESDDIRKTPFFYADGGGIKIYARSYPTIEHVEVYENYTSPCGGGVSVEHLGQIHEAAVFRNCVFRNNRTQITGAAIDLLHGSRATIENCLFVGNVANIGVDYVGMLSGGEYRPEHGSGALTVFEGSRASVSRSTFTDNWNGVDGTGSTYADCIFWKNTRTAASRQGAVTSSTSPTAPACAAASSMEKSTTCDRRSAAKSIRSIRPIRASMHGSSRAPPGTTGPATAPLTGVMEGTAYGQQEEGRRESRSFPESFRSSGSPPTISLPPCSLPVTVMPCLLFLRWSAWCRSCSAEQE